jgi:hypothetical protein
MNVFSWPGKVPQQMKRFGIHLSMAQPGCPKDVFLDAVRTRRQSHVTVVMYMQRGRAARMTIGFISLVSEVLRGVNRRHCLILTVVAPVRQLQFSVITCTSLARPQQPISKFGTRAHPLVLQVHFRRTFLAQIRLSATITRAQEITQENNIITDTMTKTMKTTLGSPEGHSEAH